MRQDSQRIIGREQRKTDQVSEDDQHEEVIQMSSFLFRVENDFMEKQSIKDLPDHLRRALQFRRKRGKDIFDQADSFLFHD